MGMTAPQHPRGGAVDIIDALDLKGQFDAALKKTQVPLAGGLNGADGKEPVLHSLENLPFHHTKYPIS